jgi:hypothetical protein
MTLDTNLISTEGLKTIKNVIDSELATAVDTCTKMRLLLESAFLESVINGRVK